MFAAIAESGRGRFRREDGIHVRIALSLPAVVIDLCGGAGGRAGFVNLVRSQIGARPQVRSGART